MFLITIIKKRITICSNCYNRITEQFSTDAHSVRCSSGIINSTREHLLNDEDKIIHKISINYCHYYYYTRQE